MISKDMVDGGKESSPQRIFLKKNIPDINNGCNVKYE